ncbi:phage tail sheath subtilisin-like domain-containing protein [Enterocloster citroniae]|uniref:phage tail sheath subtilisin-like domain-containing protein n=1 Tax=Enterocloster citroniae TaxID=358743 RepID=UPI0032BF7639
MAGTWESQNKVLPGAYINIRTNEPLSITPGDRGIVVILQEMSAGTDGAMYTITATEAAWPDGATAIDKKLATEALKKAKTVIVYKLPATHDADDVTAALAALKTVSFNVLCYPYDGDAETANKTAIATWVKSMRDDEGIKCQAVLANHAADSEGIINVVQGIVMSDSSELSAAEATAWVAGATAGASITTSNTGMKYVGAVDVSPRMTRSEMETAVKAGKFIFKVDSAQNVTVVYDINSLTTVTVDKGKMFTKNRVIRTLDNIANDITSIFESSYVGRVDNNEDGRSIFKAALVDYFNTLQNMSAVQDFETDDVVIMAGTDTDAVAVTAAVQPVDSVEKIYITVNLS